MDQVAADRMTPAHVPPSIPVRVVLIEEMIFALVINHPIRIVHEVFRRSEVKLWAENLLIVGVRTACN